MKGLHQKNFSKLQINIVDDYSIDNTYYKVINYIDSNNNGNIYLHKFEKNKGTPSFGRNYIFDNTKSEYILFFDGDDIFIGDINKVINMLEKHSKNKYPVITTQIKRVVNGEIKNPALPYYKQTFDSCNPYYVAFQPTINHIYSMEFINQHNLRYDNTRYEDAIFNVKILAKNKNPYINPIIYYGWVKHEKSFSSTINSEHFNYRINAIKKIIEVCEQIEDKEMIKYIYNYLIIVFIGNYIKGYFNINYKDMKSYITDIYSINNGDFLKRIKKQEIINNNRRVKFIKKQLLFGKDISSYVFYITNKINYLKRRSSIQSNKRSLR